MSPSSPPYDPPYSGLLKQAVVDFGRLRLGMEGDHIRALQLNLAELGYPLRGTGYFGPATDTAVAAFQRLNGLESGDPLLGVVGMATADKLDNAHALHMPAQPPEASRPLWVQAALSWLGTKEEPGIRDNPTILDWAKGLGGSTANVYTHDSIPWCALFANQILSQSSLKGTGTLWALDFAKWGVQLSGPAVGAFAPMKRNGGGHIPIVIGRDQHGNLMCIGGNQSDAVTVAPFDPARVVSYRWPSGVPLPPVAKFEALPFVKSDGKLSRDEV